MPYSPSALACYVVCIRDLETAEAGHDQRRCRAESANARTVNVQRITVGKWCTSSGGATGVLLQEHGAESRAETSAGFSVSECSVASCVMHL